MTLRVVAQAGSNRGGPASPANSYYRHHCCRQLRRRHHRPRPLPLPVTPSVVSAGASLWDRARSLLGGEKDDGGDKNGGKGREERERERRQDDDGEDGVAPPPLLEPGALPPSLPDAVVSRTFLSGRALSVAYVASRDGWSALDFHRRCDFKGPCLIVAEVEGGKGGGGGGGGGGESEGGGENATGAVFGGYYSDVFSSSDDYRSSFKPFLFAFDDDDDEDDDTEKNNSSKSKRPLEERQVFVCEKVGGAEAALFDYARGGPQFGADGLLIGPPLSPVMGGFAGPDSPTQGAGDLRTAKSRLGLSYARLPPRRDGTRRSLFGGGGRSGSGCVLGDDGRDEATLREVTVFYSPELAKMYR